MYVYLIVQIRCTALLNACVPESYASAGFVKHLHVRFLVWIEAVIVM